MADEAVFGDILQVPGGEQHRSGPSNPPVNTADAHDTGASDSTSSERRVVQRIHSQSTPQNPAGLVQAQPSGLALAAAPISHPAGVILNQRQLSQEGIDAELPRTAAVRRETDSHDDKQPELHSHPLTNTPSRKRSFTPSEGSSLLDAPPPLNQGSMGAGVNDGTLADGGRSDGVQRSGGLLGSLVPGPVQWAARGAGRLMGTLLRRNSNNRR